MSAPPAGRAERSTGRTAPVRGGPAPLRSVLRTADGVPVDASYQPGPGGGDTAGARAGELAVVVAHGFTGDLERPHVRRIARAFAQRAAVITFSFRGHGRSGGHSTVGDREVLDLAAAVAWARRLGHERVVTVGFSMGGSVTLRHAALFGPAGPGTPDVSAGSLRGDRHVKHEGRTEAHSDAVVAVSAPARWYYRGTAPMRRLHWLVTRPVGRFVGRYGFRTRIYHRDWDPVPLSPTESVPLIAPTPLLIVHGDRDPYFPLDHPRMLAAAGAADAVELWVEEGMGHAEHAASESLLARIADWVQAAAR